MVRRNYRHELRAAMTFPLATALTEGAFNGVVAAKNFHASPLLLSIITAAPMFGNIAAMMWSDIAMGRRKVPVVNFLQLGLVIMVAGVALTALMPPWVAGWVFAGLIVVARVLASGIVTIRSAIWRANYPQHIRGQVTSRLVAVTTAVFALTSFVGAWMLDIDAQTYVYVYGTAAILGLVGIHQFSQIRVRHEPMLLRQEQQLYAPEPENLAQTDETNVLNYDAQQTPRRFSLYRMMGQAWTVLREDKNFRDYQRWQMLSGFAFMMITPSLTYMVSKEMTDPREQYLRATTVVQLIPMITTILCTQLWAPLFDRVHITRFRVYQGTVSVISMLTIFAGAMYGRLIDERTALLVVAIGQCLVGVSNAGGNLAWNLGHNDFAPKDKAALYMGVHVMLTGLRGSVAPFLGTALYMLPGVGRNVFLLGAVVSFTSLIGFASMARRAPGKSAKAGPADR